MINMALLLLLFLSCAGSERILAVFPFSAQSHFFAFEPLVTELARRGHDVTVISPFPRKVPMDRYTDIDISNKTRTRLSLPLTEMVHLEGNTWGMMSELARIDREFEDIYKNSAVQQLLNSEVTFDMVITELFLSDMFIGLADKYKAPLVVMGSSAIFSWGSDRLALPDNPSYMKHFMNSKVGSMNFMDRLMNTVEMLFINWYYSYYITSNDEDVTARYLGGVSSIHDIMKNTSLALINIHFSVNKPRALPPNVVEIGGIHIKPVKPLPQDIEMFLNESEHGVVYFSLGSIANASTMSPENRKAFCNVFSRLRQRVLWKWEIDEMPEKPENVKIVKWIPQRDVLAHPNVRLFISHGGLLGTMESIHSGVPVIGIPLFGDQRQNIGNLVELGNGLSLDAKDLNEEAIGFAVNSVLNDPKFSKTAQKLSSIFRDRPSSALDTAVYWTEYILRHGGSHFRSPAVDLAWYQYLLLDVFGVLFLVCALTATALIYVVKVLLRKITSKQKVKVS